MISAPSATVAVRRFRLGDLSALLAMNNAAVPAVNGLTAEDLLDLIGSSLSCLVATLDDVPAGFLLCIGEGTDYSSANYQWLSERLSAFAYTDRICVEETHRGLQIGERLYRALFSEHSGTDRSFVCEVNERPPNPGSLKFHKRLGFEEIGKADHGDKTVVFLKRPSEPFATGALE